jgi:hypothetical protein
MSQLDQVAGDYKGVLKTLTREQFAGFVRRFGGEWVEPNALIAFLAQHPQHEATVCRHLRELFGVDLLTAAERNERIARAGAEANSTAAAAAVRSAAAAEKSAGESEAANATAREALRASRLNAYWSLGSFVVAILALIISLIR